MCLNGVQENPNAIPEGETPHNVTLLCYDPLVDVTKPGDRITVTGVLHQLLPPLASYSGGLIIEHSQAAAIIAT